jgi:glycosyltransferase involved in cell wall biosynthesis
MIDIIICTWRNPTYLRCLLESLYKNSSNYTTFIPIVFVNEEDPYTIRTLQEYEIQYYASKTNLGLCTGANIAAAAGNSPYILLLDDDMYFMPNWDSKLQAFTSKHFTDDFMVCPAMIEPTGTNPLAFAPANFGRSPESFKEQDLLHFDADVIDPKAHEYVPMYTDLGPFFLTRGMWEKIGGYSEEFNPGIGSDNDIGKKVWDTGFHDIVSVFTSRVYHFQCTSSSRLSDYSLHKENRDKQFPNMYGMSVRDFHKEQLKRGQPWLNMNS